MGWGTILYLAAIAGINPELYEAAEIDGAGRFRRIWHVTLPGIRPTIVILLVLNIGNMTFIGFERPFIFQNQLVWDVGDVISTYVYREGLRAMNFSLATAMGLFQSLVGMVFLIGANWIARKNGDRGIW
jgi:putative aldouronate transport system permease protein